MAADWPAERFPTPAARGSDLVATDRRESVPEGPPGPGRRDRGGSGAVQKLRRRGGGYRRRLM